MFKNKRITLLTLYPVCIVLVIFLVQSCCERKERLTGMGAIGQYSLVDSLSATDTLRGPFALNIYYERDVIGGIPNPVSSAYATTCAITLVNPIIPSSFSFTLNSPIYGLTDTLEAGTNLLGKVGIVQNIDAYYSSVNIHVSQGFLNEYSIPNGVHEILIAGMTQDGLVLSDSLSIAFNL
jgi:hypothetical protein